MAVGRKRWGWNNKLYAIFNIFCVGKTIFYQALIINLGWIQQIYDSYDLKKYFFHSFDAN